MAHGIESGANLIRVHQALHGYSDGHRLFASSVKIPARDAKTMLIMSDASGPGASIPDCGYLTGYPLPEAGYYAFARTWHAPEMARPGCVWTHTLLVEFSELPSLTTMNMLTPLFRRPSGLMEGYDVKLSAKPATLSTGLLARDEHSARSLLWALYANPRNIIIALQDDDADESAMAIWDQQWPRLRRSFRFCTLSYSDRSTSDASFDLQFIPSGGQISRSQFHNAISVDRSSIGAADWLEEAVSDLRGGPSGGLRKFLKEFGGDAEGREAFAPLVTLYVLSRDFASNPRSLEQAADLLEKAFPPSQARVPRALIARKAGSAPETISAKTLDFVIRNWDLLQADEAQERASKVGAALWAKDPDAIGALLSVSGPRRAIAESAVASLEPYQLIEGLGREPNLIPTLLSLRPDLAMSRSFWSLSAAWNSEILEAAFQKPDAIRSIVSSMIDGGRGEAVPQVCRIIGKEPVLRAIIDLLDAGGEASVRVRAKPWLDEASSDENIVAKVLSAGSIRLLSTLEALSQVVAPDFVPNPLGEDPWFTAWQAVRPKTNKSTPLYLSCFLLARALGHKSKNQAELIVVSFDIVYASAERSLIPDAAWRLLDDRLPGNFFWNTWDRCQRLRSGIVEAFADRRLSPEAFMNLTSNQRLFGNLVELATDTYSGRRYLKHVRQSITNGHADRLRLIDEVIS